MLVATYLDNNVYNVTLLIYYSDTVFTIRVRSLLVVRGLCRPCWHRKLHFYYTSLLHRRIGWCCLSWSRADFGGLCSSVGSRCIAVFMWTGFVTCGVQQTVQVFAFRKCKRKWVVIGAHFQFLCDFQLKHVSLIAFWS